MTRHPRLVLVEDTYGVDFHRRLIEKLRQANLVQFSTSMPRVERLPARECNPKITRSVKALIAASYGASRKTLEKTKIVVVVDQENLSPAEARERVAIHFEKDSALKGKARIVIVAPRHGAWLCIGLDPRHCRKNPEDAIVRARSLKAYEKHHLARLADQIDPTRLRGQPDFNEYLEALQWLEKDP